MEQGRGKMDYSKKRLNCSICMNTTGKQERLPCDHRFCIECVSVQISRLASVKENETVTIVCPYCRDFFLTKVAFLNAAQKKTSKQHQKQVEFVPSRGNPEFSAEVAKRCQPCAEMKEYSKSSFWCHNCSEFMCSTCAHYHKTMKMSKFHIVKTLKDKERYGDIKSKIHDTPKSASVSTHVPHTREQSRHKCEPCGETRKILEAVCLCQNCNEKMCEACCRCHRSMKMSKAHKIIKLTELVTKPEVSTDTWCSMHYGETLSLYCKRCRLSCCPICVITLHSKCGSAKTVHTKQTSEVEKQKDVTFKEIVKSTKIEENSEKMGKRKETTTKYPKYKMETRKSRINFGGNAKGDWVISMAVLASGDILLTELLQPTLKMIDCAGNLLALCSFYGDPWSVAVYNDSLAAVTFSDRKQIQLITVDLYKGLEAGKKIATRHKSLGVCFAKDLIVTSCWEGGCIHVINIKGTELCSIDKDNHGNKLFSNPEYIASNKTGTCIYVTDYKRDTVTALKLLPTRIDSKPEFVFKNKDVQGPKGVAIDRHGVLYVAGMTSRNIVRLGPSGELIQIYRRREDTDYYEALAVSSSIERLLVSAFEDNTIIVMHLIK